MDEAIMRSSAHTPSDATRPSMTALKEFAVIAAAFAARRASAVDLAQHANKSGLGSHAKLSANVGPMPPCCANS